MLKEFSLTMVSVIALESLLLMKELLAFGLVFQHTISDVLLML
jgi:hypothetical protein